MKQINYDIAGIRVSINHINNDCNEAVITSYLIKKKCVGGNNITPYKYIINKKPKKLFLKKLGTKEKNITYDYNSNETSVIEQSKDNEKEFSLTKELIL